MDNQNLSSDDEFDEVSLPGVGDNEQATILEVLNRRIVSTEDGNGNVNVNGTATGIEPTKEERHSGDTLNAIKVTSTPDDEPKTSKQDKESDILVSSSSSSRGQVEWNEPQRSQLNEDEENVFDIESHLIETLNNYSVSEDSESWGVDIKELPPAEGESLYRTSKIETDPSIGTVFEVEPATPKVLKPVETSVPEPQRQSGLAQKAEEEQTSVDSEVKRQESVSEVEQPKKRRKPGETSVSEPQKQSGLAQKAQEDETSVDSEVKDSNAEKQQESVIEVEQPKEKRDLGETSVAEPQRQSGLAQKAQEEQISIDSEVKGSNAKKEQESVSEVEQSKEKKEPDETTSPEPQRQSGLAQKAQEERTSADSEVKDSNAKKQQESVIEVEKSKEKRESDEITSPEPQGQSELEQEENIFADSEVRGSNAEKKPESVNKFESHKQRTEQAETTVPEPQKTSGLAQRAQEEQISVDFDQEINSTNAEKKPESLTKVKQSDESIEPVETTVPEAQSGIAQNIRAVIDPPADDNEPVWKILKELQTQLEAAQVEPSALPTKVELDRCEESSSVSNENTEPKLYLAASAEEISGPVVQSNEVEKPLETAGLKIIDSEGATDPTKSKTDSITQDQKVELILESVDSTEQVKPEIVTPTEPLQKAEEELVHGSINVSSTTEEPKADHHEKPIPVGDSSAEKQGDTHDTVDNAQSINATKIQIDPTAPDPRVDVQALTEKLLIGATIEKSNEDTKTDLLSKEREHTSTGVEDSASLTQEIDQKLSELATHLASSSKVDLNGNIPKETSSHLESEEIALDINGLPLPKTAHEEEQRQQFLDSLPQISLETDSNKVAALAKREYYQSLRQYLITHSDKPPVPPETYRWEDLKRAKQRGGYPWTHLYKRPLGTDEEPEIVLLLRKSQELRFSSESPKSSKKVRIDDQVSIKETERYIQELSDVEDNPTTEDEEEAHEDERSECISCVSDSVLTVEKRSSKLGKLRGILKKRSPKKESDARSLPDTSTAPSTSALTRKSEEDISERPRRPPRESQNQAKCFPIMKKLKSMADRQKKNFRNIKKISLKKDEKISLEEEQKIIKLKTSPKAERSEIPHFIEKQDSDDVLEIVELDESPSRKRKDQLELQEQAAAAANESTVLVPDEIIEIPADVDDKSSDRQQTPEPTVSEILEEELKSNPVFAAPPKKTARLRREHVYEDIEDDNGETISDEINNILELASVEALKQSLAKQDSSALKDVDSAKTVIPLDRMGSSEEEVERVHLAPISSIDSASSDDERKPHLSPVAEESDDGITLDKEDTEKLQPVLEVIKEPTEHIPWNDIDLKPALKKEASPSPSDKKVTFSHVEDEAEPHREDIELPEGLPGIGPKRWSNLRANQGESRPTSKQGFVGDMEHHFDNTSARSFNMMGRQPEFDRISATSFGGRMHGMEGRGLVVRSISDATDPEMVGGMMAGHRGRQMSIGGISSGSGRDPDAVSIRSGISLRRISRSPSHADLFVADLNIPAPHIPRLNITAPTPTPTVGHMSPPDFSIYDRKTMPSGSMQPNRWRENNKENIRRQHEVLLPQNKPIDISIYGERNAFGRVINEPMDVDVAVADPVIDIKDNIRIDRMSPPLQENVPDLSPVVEDETRIEIRDFAPQPDLRPVDEILADEKPPGHFDSLNVPGSHSHRQTSPAQSFQLTQLKRQHGHERDISPDYSKKQFMQGGSPTKRMQYVDTDDYMRESQHVEGRQFMQYGSTPTGTQSFQRASSPTPTGTQKRIPSPSTSFQRGSSPMPAGVQHMETQQFMQRGSPPTAIDAKTFQRASSPPPGGMQHLDTMQLHQRGSPQAVSGMHHMDITQSIQRGSSPAPTRGTQPFQRASSPPPGGMQHLDTNQLHQRGLPQAVSGMPHMDISQSIQRGSSPAPARSTQPFQGASSAAPPGMQHLDTKQHHQRGSPPAVSGMHNMDISQSTQRGSSPAPARGAQPFQRAASPAPASSQPRQVFQNGSHLGRSFLETSDHTEKPQEDKQSYSSRFMSMFHSKTPDQATKLDTPPQDQRKMSMSQFLHIDRRRSPSPGKQLKPESSPTPSRQRLMSVFMNTKHEHPTAMSVVEGTHAANMSIKKAPEEKLLTVKVTETFSLKVDEMDQYSSRPPKSPSPVRHSRLYASSEQLGLTQDRISGSMDFYGDRQEAFSPVVVPSGRSSHMQLQAGDRSHYMSSSQTDLRSSRRLDSHEHNPPAPHAFTFGNNKKLVSVPIDLPDDIYDTEMTSSEFIHEEPEDQPSYSQAHRTDLIKAPSEQRLAQSKLLQRKSYISDRTQSHDRAALDRASELDTLSISTRSKTVSFSFGERDSRLSQHEKMIGSNDQLDKKSWLERTYFCDHEYEPIGEPAKEIKSQPTAEPLVSALKKEPSPAPQIQELPKFEISQPVVEATSDEASSPSKSDELKEAEELQKNIEDRYFSSAATPTPIETTQTDYEIHTSQVDLSAFEQPPLKDESKKKGFMANAQDRTRKMQAGLKNQAGKIKTKFRSPKKVPSGSPKAKERKRFKAPEFSKIKMPEIKRPDLSGFKRPEFTKFSKPDMSKFKLPDKFSSLKLTRSKSFKEPTEIEETTVSGTTPESTSAAIAAPAKKARFDFSFGTYPRAFRKKKKPQEVEGIVDEPSVIPSTETQPSAESSSTPQGDRGPGPVRSRWADKFSDVSYNDSEGSRYRRYGSEQESSFDRESSMERRMKEVLDENEKEEAELAMLSVVEKKQFDDYDEENRAIHEISKTREGEFKRRPMVHQDSDLVSEEGRDIGWTEREAQKIQILRKAELEAEAHLRYLTERESNPETHSTASSKKLVFEEINDDEFLLRNKGISQEFNIGNQRFLDPDMEAAFDNSPNALEFIGVQASSLNGSSIDRIDYGYDVPPPKPRRLSHQQRQRHYDSENASQIDEYADEISLSQAGSDYYKHAPPSRPLRKGRFKNSQEISIGGTPSVQFDEEEFDDRVDRALPRHDDDEKENILQDRRNDSPIQPPQAPRRRRKQLRDSLEKDSYVNGFGGRSVSNSYLREDNKPEEVIVYRTEHEYKIPLATPENYTDTSTPPRKSRSLSRLAMDEDDHTSHGADSLALDTAMRGGNNNANLDDELQEKYIIEMMENDGYAIVRKENLPKPTPPARRKKFSRSPGERFATMPHLRRGSPAVQEPKSSSRNYSTIGRPTPPRRKSAQSLGADSQKEFGSEDFGDYEVPELDDRTESPRNLQSGDIINKMKYRPLPPPPRPPREKRHIQRDRQGDDDDEFDSRDDRDDRDGGGERIVSEDFLEQSSDDYNLQPDVDKSIEVEVSTQTDPLPDDFVCEEFEITEDMKIIEPRRAKTLDEILKEEEEADLERARQIDDEVLVKGIQRFREANQRSASEKSRASSQAKSLSRPQTPSAILIEKRVPTPVPYANGQTVLEASLTVQPIDDLDLEEELLRREGLYDGSHSHSKSGSDSRYRDEEEEAARGSEEENARIGEEERSYTRSTDAESQRLEEEEQDRRLVERLLEAERLQREEDEEQRLLEELEKEERLLDAEKQIRLLEEEKRALRLQEEEEKEKQKLLDDLEKEQRLRPDSRSDEHDSYDDEQTERLKAEDSYELKSEVSEENEATPRPTTPISALPPTEEDVISVLQQIKLLSQPKLLEQREKYEPDEEPPSPPPTAPPRKRSTATSPLEDQNEILSVTEQQPATAAVPITPVMPSQLTLADLEVERLRVHALQAGQIMVSHLHGSQIQADELECRSGNLVVRNIELPPGFIEDIVERVRITEREHTQAIAQPTSDEKPQTEQDSIPPPPIPTRHSSDVPPVRPPPPQRESIFPSEYMQPSPSAVFLQHHDGGEPPVFSRSVLPTEYLQSVPPIGFFSHRSPDDEGEPTPPVYRRRRHHRRRDSSSEEDHQRRRSRSARPEPQSVAQAGRQFISACSLPLTNVINQLTNSLRPNNDNKQDQVQPRNISAAVVLFIVMALTFLIYLLTGRNIHHHHWDYFNPPGNDGRLS